MLGNSSGQFGSQVVKDNDLTRSHGLWPVMFRRKILGCFMCVCMCTCVCKLGALVVTHQGELLITVIQIKIKVLAFMLLWLTCDDELSLFIYEK